MIRTRLTRAAGIALAAAWLAGCGNALVGGRCEPGYVANDGGCVRTSLDGGDASLDAMRDGAPLEGGDTGGDTLGDTGGDAGGDSGLDAGDGGGADAGDGGDTGGGGDAGDGSLPFDGSQEGGPLADGGDAGGIDGTGGDGVGGDGVGGDGTGGDGGGGDGRAGDGGADVACTGGDTLCSGACVDTGSDPDNCGACGTACTAGHVCARGVCQLVCPVPLVNCGGACVDLQTDETNCGACGNVCRSGICNAGICRDARAGHMILIGHTYTVTRPDQDQILRNGVFLAAPTTARVLAYQQFADTTPVTGAVANADTAISAGARPWIKTVLASSTTLSSTLSIDRFDVMLIYEQRTASDGQIATLATDMGDALSSFVHAGGIVIVLDGAIANGGTYPIAVATGLFDITGVTNIDNMIVSLNPPAAGDALAVRVATSYRAAHASVTFTTTDSYSVFVLGTAPVVMHRAVLGPTM